MSSGLRKIMTIVVWGCSAASVLALVSPARAQTDLNRFVPKFSSPADRDGREEGEVERAPATRRSYSNQPQRRRRPQPSRPQQASEPTEASEEGQPRDEAPRYKPQGTGAGRVPKPGDRSYSNNSQRQAAPRMAMNSAPRSVDDGPTADRANLDSRSRGRGMYENSVMSNRPPMRGNERQFDSEEAGYEQVDERQFAEAAASYQSSSGYDRNANRPLPGQAGMNRYGGPNGGMGYGSGYGGSGYGGSGYGGSGYGGRGGSTFGGLFGPTASRQPGGFSGMSLRNWMTGRGAAPVNVASLPDGTVEPIVTPDAVYLDAEPVKAGKPAGPTMAMPSLPDNVTPMYPGPMIDGEPIREGRSFLPGGPIQGRSYDGFTNPQCNDCCGGDCGGGCGNCGGGNCGPRCGDNYGMYGGCEEGYDCCGGCGPNYGLFNGPYGRPWILAPLDFVFGGLWHCGPYWGACDPCGDWWWGQDLTVFGGVHDFSSPVNINGNSNFGTQEGVNWSMPFWHEYGIGAQVGYQATQSNFQNTDINAFDDYRTQSFLTAGLFHRPCDGCGWQYGVVFDWLHDNFYQQFDVGQVRGDISWLFDTQNELGFWFATGVMKSNNQQDPVFLGATQYSAINQYAFYYRRRFCRGGEGRLWGGFTGNSGGLVGADFRLPLSHSWAVETGFNYIISDKNNSPNFHNETWNIGSNLVWYWGGNANCRSLYRPLFNVADNGSFMVQRSGVTGP